jgi:uncharacterized membrane protein YqjE
MEESTVSFGQLAATSKHFARRLLTIGENRLELLTVEVQEERERLLHAFLLALGVAAFGLLAGLTLTAAIVVLLWAWSPVAVLLILTGLYGAAGIFFTGGSPDCCATGRRFPPRSTNSERTAHVWKKSSHEPARIAETIVDRGKRTQPRATGSGMADDGGRSSRARPEPSVPSLPPPPPWLPALRPSGARSPAPAVEKPSWLQTILKGAGLLSTVWQAFRSPGRDPDGN